MLILPFAYHVKQFDAVQQRLCSAKRFEYQHLFTPAFYIMVILLNQIVQVFALPESDAFLSGFVDIEPPLSSIDSISGSS